MLTKEQLAELYEAIEDPQPEPPPMTTTNQHKIIIKDVSEPSVDPGTYLARCFRIVDAGTQIDGPYGEKHKLIVTWELPYERIEVEGKDLPRSISKFYTFSLNSKATLRKDLVAWRGRDFTPEELAGFELAKILGTACQVTVVLSKTGKARVETVSGVPRGTQVPPLENLRVEYSIQQGQDSVFEGLPDWLKKIIPACEEWQKPNPLDPPAHPGDETSEDFGEVPF